MILPRRPDGRSVSGRRGENARLAVSVYGVDTALVISAMQLLRVSADAAFLFAWVAGHVVSCPVPPYLPSPLRGGVDK